MTKFYSKRKKDQPEELRYDIPEDCRARILAVMQDFVGTAQNSFDRLLSSVGHELRKAYGYLDKPSYHAARVSDDPVIDHFFQCEDDLALDFIEAYLQDKLYTGQQAGVDAINDVFSDMGIGYELTPWAEFKKPSSGPLAGLSRGAIQIE